MLRGTTFFGGLEPLPPNRLVRRGGIFEDGTRADWWSHGNNVTAIKQLALRYGGPVEYMNGPGTDSRSVALRTAESLLGVGRRERLRNVAAKLELWRPEMVDFFGWSRGADELIAACEVARQLGVVVGFLGLFDPVPARGWGAFKRVLPFAKLQLTYERPPVEQVLHVGQILAGDEHRKKLRHARMVPVITGRDFFKIVPGDHRTHVVGTDGADWMQEQAERVGVPWRSDPFG